MLTIPLPHASALGLPARIADHAMRLRREIDAIASRRAIDAVYAPIWDCEGIALLRDPRFPLVAALQDNAAFLAREQSGDAWRCRLHAGFCEADADRRDPDAA